MCEIPLLEKYCKVLQDFLDKRDYSQKLLAKYENVDEIETVLNLKVLEESRNKYKCVQATIELSFTDVQLNQILIGVEEVDISFIIYHLILDFLGK